MLRDVVAHGPSKSRRINNVGGYLFPLNNSLAQVNGLQNRGFPWATKLQWGYGHAIENRR